MSKLIIKSSKEKEISFLQFLDKTGEEEDVSKFFSDRFEKIFPKLKLFRFGESKKTKLGYKEGENKGEFDAISFYPEENTFIIFEYKVSKDKLLDQIYKYLGAFSGIKLKNDLVELLNKNFPNASKSWWSISDIDWEALKIVCLSTDFYEWQNSALIPDERIVWIKVEWYKENDNDVVILEGEDKDFLFLEKLSRESLIILPSETSPNKEEAVDPRPLNLLQLLNKIGSSEEISKWIKQIHEILVREYFLASKVYYNEGSGWRGVDYNIKDKGGIFSLFWTRITKKKGFSIYFPRSLSSLLGELVKKYNLQEKPTVYFLAVTDETEFLESISMLREFLSRKDTKKSS